jgi:hypothetical protein
VIEESHSRWRCTQKDGLRAAMRQDQVEGSDEP